MADIWSSSRSCRPDKGQAIILFLKEDIRQKTHASQGFYFYVAWSSAFKSNELTICIVLIFNSKLYGNSTSHLAYYYALYYQLARAYIFARFNPSLPAGFFRSSWALGRIRRHKIRHFRSTILKLFLYNYNGR